MTESIILLLCFFVVTAFIGIYCRKKDANVGDFVLGGRSVGPWLSAFAYGTSYFSAVVFVGYAGQFGWNFGVSATWIGLGNALIGSLIPWLLLGKKTRIMTNHLHTATMPDFFKKRYDSKALGIFASLLIFVFLIPYSASVYKGLSGIFAMSFNLDFKYCIMGMALITAIYVVVGGYMATALNDFIQGIIMLIGIVLVVFYVLNGQGGFTEAVSRLSEIELSGNTGELTSLFGPDGLTLLSVLILTSLGTWGLPQMVHKFYAIKDERSIKTGTVISTVFALIVAGGSYFMGAFGRLYYTAPAQGPVYDDIVPSMLQSSLPNILLGIVLVLVLSASMSTLSALVLSSSSTVVLDLIAPYAKNKITTKKKVVLIRIFCAIFIIISVIIAIRPNTMITALMSTSWGALAGAFVGPFLYGLFSKRVTKVAVWSSMIVGVGITVANMILNFESPIKVGGLSILLSFVIVPIVSLFTPKMDKKHVNDVFACYENSKTLSDSKK
ncbi:MAG: sodium:solute symporter family protein [Clostridiales bacterium]|nr:sodium:solute symporter family protein [Clostridiales bacterium]